MLQKIIDTFLSAICDVVEFIYSVVSIKRTGSLNYFGVFSHPVLFFHVLKKNFAPPCSFFHVLKKNFAPPCSLITSCSLNRYYRVRPVVKHSTRKGEINYFVPYEGLNWF